MPVVTREYLSRRAVGLINTFDCKSAWFVSSEKKHKVYTQFRACKSTQYKRQSERQVKICIALVSLLDGGHVIPEFLHTQVSDNSSLFLVKWNIYLDYGRK